MNIEDQRIVADQGITFHHLVRGDVYTTVASPHSSIQYHMLVNRARGEMLNVGTGINWTADNDKRFVAVKAKLIVEN